MKTVFKSLLIIGLFSNLIFSQVKWNLDYDSANFAFLVVDYTTYNFEGGYFTKFDYHPGYDREYIPFSIEYNQPIDYGNILFTYAATNDTIFAADIWWAGTGLITFPTEIEDASQFTYDSTLQILPFTISYLNYVDEIAGSTFQQKADSVWTSVKRLSVLKKFNEEGNVFRVALYLYAPAVGMFRPEVAKWIVFLYRGQLIVDVKGENIISNNYSLLQNYPNPFNPTTAIEFNIPSESNVKLNVYNSLGQLMTTLIDEELSVGNHKVIFDGNDYPSGIYFYRIISGDYRETRKMILLK